MIDRTSPEARLLVVLTDLSVGDDVLATVLDREAGFLNWATFLDLAVWHRVVPLVADRIARVDTAEQVPRWVSRLLSDSLIANAERNRRLVDAANELVSEFDAAGLRVLVRKGLPLARFAYGDLALRRMADIDLFVLPDTAGSALDVLAASGFTSSMSREAQMLLQMGRLNLPQHSRHHGAPSLPKVSIGLAVDLFERGTSMSVPLEDLFERARVADLAGYEIPTLDPVDFLMDVSAHFFKDATSLATVAWRNDLLLQRVGDVGGLLSLLDPDQWATFLERAHGYGIVAPMYFACWYVLQVYPGCVDVDLAQLAPPGDDRSFLRGFGESGRQTHHWPDDDVLGRLFDRSRADPYASSSRWARALGRPARRPAGERPA